MKKFSVPISQNGWEYTGYAYIKCENVTKVSTNAIIADGIEIEFDEEVGLITEIDVNKSVGFYG
jgi:hypothetical protein